MLSIHFFVCIFLVISCFCVCFAENSMQSVIFLILAFCNCSVILFIFNVEFLGLLYIIIYVGAIAVLFLFVIMMLNVKVNISKNINNSSINIFYFLLLILFSYVLFYFINLIIFRNSIENFSNKSFLSLLENLNNIDILGQVLYNNFLICFLLAGLLLLVALIGAVVLTLNFNSVKKNQLSFRQLARSDNFLSFFK